MHRLSQNYAFGNFSYFRLCSKYSKLSWELKITELLLYPLRDTSFMFIEGEQQSKTYFVLSGRNIRADYEYHLYF